MAKDFSLGAYEVRLDDNDIVVGLFKAGLPVASVYYDGVVVHRNYKVNERFFELACPLEKVIFRVIREDGTDAEVEVTNVSNTEQARKAVRLYEPNSFITHVEAVYD